MVPSVDKLTLTPLKSPAASPSISLPSRLHPTGPKSGEDWSVTAVVLVTSYLYTLT